VGCNWKAYIIRNQLWAKSLSLGLHLSQRQVPIGLLKPVQCLLDVCSKYCLARSCKHPINRRVKRGATNMQKSCILST